MRIELDTPHKRVLLKWLQQGYIEPLDIPEAYKGANYFLELMKSLPDE